ncbi:hypothetical protein Micbo1qcDRAFT_42540 [Microdochium bolleyi]|uniref:Uncharacterized protein n=1 Tax=Microdochium bolleyi TaxID=196109 RepID=A0A136JAR1_9PEZI|nr:hypothetical protein Micbo1qcDRAFT_42540 [Microdochium bolleyi]
MEMDHSNLEASPRSATKISTAPRLLAQLLLLTSTVSAPASHTDNHQGDITFASTERRPALHIHCLRPLGHCLTPAILLSQPQSAEKIIVGSRASQACARGLTAPPSPPAPGSICPPIPCKRLSFPTRTWSLRVSLRTPRPIVEPLGSAELAGLFGGHPPLPVQTLAVSASVSSPALPWFARSPTGSILPASSQRLLHTPNQEARSVAARE